MTVELLVDTIALPKPSVDGSCALERALAIRRSVRVFSGRPLQLPELGQLLWACQGRTSPDGYRTAPSAGATFPLEIYAAVGAVESIPAGIYHYAPAGHQLALLREGDVRARVASTVVDQDFIADASVILVIAALYARTAEKYGAHAARYAAIEAGCVSQNAALQGAALGIGSVMVGAINESAIQKELRLPGDHRPVLLMPFGR